MQAVTDFERGQDDYLRGLRRCPFIVQARKEAWLDGWRTAERAAYAGAFASYRARQMNAELPQSTRDVLALKGMI